MRLALVSSNRFFPPMLDGGSVSTFQRLRRLKELGAKVQSLSFVTNSARTRSMIGSPVAQAVPETSTGSPAYRSERDGVTLCWYLLPDGSTPQEVARTVFETVRRCAPDFAIVLDDDIPAIFAAAMLGIPSAHMLNSRANVELISRADPMCRRIMSKEQVFALSSFIQALARRLLGLETRVWRPFIDLSRYRVARKDRELRAVGYCSAGPAKGDSVVNRLIERLPQIRFVIAGGLYQNSAGQEAGNLKYLGQVPDMDEFYGAIDLLLVPSMVDEGFGRVILEAAASGIPAIANRVGGIPEALGDSGVLLDVNLAKPDLDGLADRYALAIRRLQDDQPGYEALCRRARLRAEQHEVEQDQVSRQVYEDFVRSARRAVPLGSAQ